VSNTVEIPLPEATWTKLASGPSQGYISNESSSNFIVKEDLDVGMNEDIFGHVVDARDTIGFTFDLKNNQAIWAHSTSKNSKATVTPIG